MTFRFGLFGPDDGYANPREVLAGFRRAAEAAGATYVTGSVTRVTVAGGRVQAVILDDVTTVPADALVNAAGPFAARLAAMAGVDLPVTPVPPAPVPLRPAPTAGRTAFRSWSTRPASTGGTTIRRRRTERIGSSSRRRNWTSRPARTSTATLSRWESDFRPPLVGRLPALEAAELVEGWAGLYEMTPDHNPLIGPHPDIAGFYLANGFSGHGLMMSPAVGAAMADLLTTGASKRIDLTPFDPARFERGEAFHDDAMI